MTLHAVLLVVLACWYFAPRSNGPITFDSRLAGSPKGVPEGEMLTGGLNTPLPMPAAPLVDNVARHRFSRARLSSSSHLWNRRFGSGRQESQRRWW